MFTIEEIKRLVPEATEARSHDWFQVLLTTRRQLEIAMEALDELARLGNAPNLGNSHGNIMAQQALESIKKVGE